jgi:hypothetical protein
VPVAMLAGFFLVQKNQAPQKTYQQSSVDNVQQPTGIPKNTDANVKTKHNI